MPHSSFHVPISWAVAVAASKRWHLDFRFEECSHWPHLERRSARERILPWEWPTGLQLYSKMPQILHTSSTNGGSAMFSWQNVMKERPMHRARLPHTATHTAATFAEGAATRHRRAAWQRQNVVKGCVRMCTVRGRVFNMSLKCIRLPQTGSFGTGADWRNVPMCTSLHPRLVVHGLKGELLMGSRGNQLQDAQKCPKVPDFWNENNQFGHHIQNIPEFRMIFVCDMW